MKYNPVLKRLAEFADSAVDSFGLHTGLFMDFSYFLPSSECFSAFYDLSGKFKNFFSSKELGLFEMVACLPLSGDLISVVNYDVVTTRLSNEQVVKYCGSCFRELADCLNGVFSRFKCHVSNDVRINLVNVIFNIRDRFCNDGSFYNKVIKNVDYSKFSNSFKKSCSKLLREY